MEEGGGGWLEFGEDEGWFVGGGLGLDVGVVLAVGRVLGGDVGGGEGVGLSRVAGERAGEGGSEVFELGGERRIGVILSLRGMEGKVGRVLGGYVVLVVACTQRVLEFGRVLVGNCFGKSFV